MDEYASDDWLWWHLSVPAPELCEALDDGWLRPPASVLDLGCGLGTELAYLSDLGFTCTGVDLSAVALGRARVLNRAARFIRADVLHLPFAASAFDLLLDRGCFHYVATDSRLTYAREAARVLRPNGKLLLRACLRSAGVRNEVDEEVLRTTFSGWHLLDVRRRSIPSDTRLMEALVARLEAKNVPST